MSIQYNLEPLAPGAHLLAVTVSITDPQQFTDNGVLTVKMPRWIPGSYKIRDYARNVVNLQAKHRETPLTVNKSSSYAWQIECDDDVNALTLTYHVYAFDLSVRGAYYDHTRCFFNPCCVFVEVEGADTQPLSLHLNMPDGWTIYTALPKDGKHYEARHYDHLIDCPVEASPTAFTTEFVAGDIAHHQVFTGNGEWHNVDTDVLNHELKNIVTAEMLLFDGSPLEQDYTFMTFVGEGQYGGLEHCHSTALMASPSMLPKKGEKKPYRKDVVDFLGLCSHEYLHLWNVKRLKPSDLLPYDLYNEQHTDMLWMFEGFTSYYDDLLLLRAGTIDKHTYLKRVGKNLTRVMNLDGRKVMTLAESSFDAWTKLYLADENAPNSLVSYYSKGAVFALYLDLWIRKESDNQASLDNVMRELWLDFACAEPVKGIDEDDVFSACARCVPEDKHDALQQVFVTGIHSCEDLDIQAMLSDFAVSVHVRPEKINGVAVTSDPELTLKSDKETLHVATIKSDSNAAQSGLSANDEILAIDGKRMDKATATTYLKTRNIGDKVTMTVIRMGTVYEFKFNLSASKHTEWLLMAEMNSELRDEWLITWIE